MLKRELLRRVLCICLWALMPLAGMCASLTDSVNVYLSRFEQTDGAERTAVANRLMRLFYQEELSGEPIVFTDALPSDSLCQQVWYWSAEHYYAVQDFKQARTYAQRALPLCEGRSIEADCLNLLSLSCFRLSDYQQAAEYAKRCYKLDERTGDPDLMSSSLNTLAGIYIGANQPKEAEKYILKGIEYARQANNPRRQAVLLGMASEVYHAMGNDAEALSYIDKACKVEEEQGTEERLMVRLAQKASVLVGMHRYQEAEQVLARIIPFFRQRDNKHSLGIACNKMGMTLLSQEREAEAVPYYREAARMFVSLGDMRNEMHARRGLYESLWTSCPDSAKIELDRFNELKDSLYSNATAESLARYHAEFGTDQLRMENEAQRHRAHTYLWMGILFVILLVALVWMGMHRRMRMREEALQTIIEGLKKDDNPEEELAKDTPDGDEASSSALDQADRLFLSQLVSFVMKGLPKGDVTVESLASDMCITRGQLNRKIKAVTGITTQQYVLRIRMEYARLLLRQSPELSIFDVSCRCGFDDATSFSRAFRRTYGQTPSQYRETASK